MPLRTRNRASEQAGAQLRSPSVRLGTSGGRWVLGVCVLGSGLAGIDASVVNVALPALGRDLHAPFAVLQWTVTAYTLTLASLILLGGATGDRYGRRRMFVVGVAWFAGASLLCAFAPSAGWLIGARALQGVGAALLTPASLAIIQATFAPADRAEAVGSWAGFSGIATAVAPFVGGWLVEHSSWRTVFLVNPPLALLIVAVAPRHVPETRDADAVGRVDLLGSGVVVAGLGGLTYALIAAPARGWASPPVVVAAAGGLGLLAAFVAIEARTAHPLVPLSMFAAVQFSAANAVTFAIYGAISGFLFLLVVALQTIAGFSPLVAGSALLPISVIVLLLSRYSGELAQRIGPRLQLAVGPVLCAAGVLLARRIDVGVPYVQVVLPAVVVFGLGLATFVAPLTAGVLAAAPVEHSGAASGVNNALARAAGLVAVAALPALIGLGGHAYTDPAMFLPAFRKAVWICASAFVLGALIAAATIRRLDADDGVPDSGVGADQPLG